MNFKETKTLLLFIFISLKCIGQFKVKDSLDNKPIEHVFIIQKNLLKASTDKDGNFNFKSNNKKDSLVFYHMGYKLLKISVDDLSYKKYIYLKPIEKELKEVIITQSQKRKEIYPPKKASNFLMINKPAKIWYSSQIALYIPHKIDFNEYLINKIFIHTVKGYWDKDESSKYVPFKVNLYSVDSITKLPGEKIFADNYIIQRDINKNRIEVLLLERLNFPIDGIFIVVETFDQDQTNNRPAFLRVKNPKNSQFQSYFKSLLIKDGKYSEWTNNRLSNIDANYYFGLEIVKY